MEITKEIIQCILSQKYWEKDWDKKSGGEVEVEYQISNLFHSEEFAHQAIEQILKAYKEVMGI